MINKVYRLISPRQIRVDFEDITLHKDKILVKPTMLSICKADQRYYMGMREKEVLKKKLPMALIHEGAGEVVFDYKKEFNQGDKIVMIPNTPVSENKYISENYLRDSKFRGSGFDGFMQEYIVMERDRVVRYNSIKDSIASFIELISVVMHSIKRFEIHSSGKKDILAVWGDGNIGFITCLLLKKMYPMSKIIAIGKNEEKLNLFSFVDETYQIDENLNNLKIDHAFEAVGGKSSQYAINQMIDVLNPQGCISLLGVCEEPIEINTRLTLEKGILLIGSSRSEKRDFEDTVKFLENNIDVQNHLEILISEEVEVTSVEDMNNAFVSDLKNQFKTIINWNI